MVIKYRILDDPEDTDWKTFDTLLTTDRDCAIIKTSNKQEVKTMAVKENIMDTIDTADGTDMELFATEAERNDYIGEAVYFDAKDFNTVQYRKHNYCYFGKPWSKDTLKMFLEGR